MGFVRRGTSVFFRVLGAIEVVEDGTSFPLGCPRQRSVLADLVMHAGQTVPTVQLIDDVWGEDPPASAVHTVETYVSRLRQVLGTSRSAVPLLTKPTGYMVDVPLDHVDVWQFRDLAARGGAAAEQGDAASAVSLLTSALALWRGAALADVREAAFAAVAAERLDGERLTALEDLMAARLRLGHHRELVPELEALVAGSPYREGLPGQRHHLRGLDRRLQHRRVQRGDVQCKGHVRLRPDPGERAHGRLAEQRDREPDDRHRLRTRQRRRPGVVLGQPRTVTCRPGSRRCSSGEA
ncbi:MAG TPA: AfsR/SARP family transcriptional regulator [Streptosporangiaceae bacterium]